MSLSSLIKLIRIEHWVKNLFLFIPAFFAARLSEPLIIEHALLGFLAFSMVASSVYVLNDIVDAPNDRNHPDKCRRPIASGAISQQQGIVILGLLLLPGIVISALLSQGMLIYASIYSLINVA